MNYMYVAPPHQVSMEDPVGMEIVDSIQYLVEQGLHHTLGDLYWRSSATFDSAMELNYVLEWKGRRREGGRGRRQRGNGVGERERRKLLRGKEKGGGRGEEGRWGRGDTCKCVYMYMYIGPGRREKGKGEKERSHR